MDMLSVEVADMILMAWKVRRLRILRLFRASMDTLLMPAVANLWNFRAVWRPSFFENEKLLRLLIGIALMYWRGAPASIVIPFFADRRQMAHLKLMMLTGA
jgi:hypothetical protein